MIIPPRQTKQLPEEPEISFHQVTSTLNPGTYKNADDRGPQLPPDLLEPLTLDAAEQAFAVRAYRHSLRQRYHWASYFGSGSWGWQRRWNATYAPLLDVMAAEDPQLDALHVAGAAVAHFPIRKAAAEALAQATGKPASYRGLDGALNASDAVPRQPYPNQNALVAAYLLDQVQAAGAIVRPGSDRDWDRLNVLAEEMRHDVDEESFGKGLTVALLAEAQRRGIAAQLKTAGYSLWRAEP